MSASIEIRGATARYGRRVALASIDVSIEAGAVAALIGPNGSGKSTLLGLISGLLAPATGSVHVDGRSPDELGARLAYVLQQTEANQLLPVTVREVVTMARYAHRGLLRPLRRADRAAVEQALERMEIVDLADRHLSALSGGQRQRALVAQGLAQEADVLLLDEPVTGLDLVSQRLIWDAVLAETEQGRTVVLSTHDLADAKRADCVVLLAGRVVAAGPPSRVLTAEVLGEAYGRRFVPVEGETMLEDVHGPHIR